MRRLVFYVDAEADPLVELCSVALGDDAAMVATACGLKRADQVEVGDQYKWGGTCRRVDAVEVTP